MTDMGTEDKAMRGVKEIGFNVWKSYHDNYGYNSVNSNVESKFGL